MNDDLPLHSLTELAAMLDRGETTSRALVDACIENISARDGKLHASFTRAVNYAGACGLTLPAGFSGAGLPIGVQLIGAPFTEATLVRLGRAFQEATGWHRRRPVLD